MSTASMNTSSNTTFRHLHKILSSTRFLNKEGLANEVPFFIVPYPASDAVEMKKLEAQLSARLTQDGIRVLTINLYEMSIALLNDRNILQRILQVERDTPKDKLKQLLGGVLDPEQHLIPAIAKTMRESDFEIMFLTGVGEVFPYIRSHNVLNNLQATAKDQPTVMFFPGEYRTSSQSGTSLDLFDRLHDDRYYRAFNIYQIDA